MSAVRCSLSTLLPPYPHPACLDDAALLAQCSLAKNRTTGPGGQHRNKVETAVELLHRPTGIEAHADERRSVAENTRVALRRLRLNLAVGVRLGVPLGAIGSALWKSRVQGGRIVCSPEHHDYPSLLAEALDVLAAAGWDPRRTALRLVCTASQLVRFIKDHPAAFEMMNAERAKRRMRRLK